MPQYQTRREFMRHLGLGAAALPFLGNLPSLGFENAAEKKQRLVIFFSPDGTIPKNFWPEEEGEKFALKKIMEPLAPWQDQMMILNGVNDQIRGDGDSHMRGMGCLLTGTELFPGNIQGGSHTPAGWASGLSIDQEIKQFLQRSPATQTRFGSLEFGVLVPDRADTWTRMIYTGPNKPVTPIDNPYQMYAKLYGQIKNREDLVSILDDLQEDLNKVRSVVSSEDRELLDEQASFVREMEKELAQKKQVDTGHAAPKLEQGLREQNDNMPKFTRMQLDLLFNSLQADFTRIASFQFTNSVGNAKMHWLGIDEGQHSLSHEPDDNEEAVEKLTKINFWYAEQIAHLAKRLAETPEPGSTGSMLDHTTILWTNELGKGNSHTLNNIPFVMLGGGFGYKMGRSMNFKGVPHNRLLLTLAHGFGHHLERFGNPDYSEKGPLVLS